MPPAAWVRVAVALPVHGLYTYAVPATIGALAPGDEVEVPFGTRRVIAWVVEVLDAPDVQDARPVVSRTRDEAAFTPAQLALYRFVADYWLAPLGEVIATATPSGSTARTRRVYVPTDAGIAALAGEGAPVPEGPLASMLREVVARPGATRTGLARRLRDEVDDPARALTAIVTRGWVEGRDEQVQGPRDTERWAVRTPDTDAAAALAGLRGHAVAARALLARLAVGPVRADELESNVLATLVRRGAVRIEERPRTDGLHVGAARTEAPPLNAAQSAVVAAVDGAGTWLLHGVTGSGKTEVYLALAARTLAAGGQVLVLVPEIALTPQLLGRFAGRFGDRVAVLHSQLTGAERLRAWRAIARGDADVVVGARSAVFAPFHALGLVVVDEEHDDSYKQEDGVRYHARDLAVVRAHQSGCPAVLGSATPSLESWENARSGRYRLLQMRDRATPRPVPRLSILDMRQERVPDPAGGKPREPLLAAAVHDAIGEALDAGGKAILLYNRRGYATFVECPGCGAAHECPSCGIALVLHQAARRLHCHTCGYHRPFDPRCATCGSAFEVLGRGTERVAEGVAEAFPGVPIGRMDADTTAGRGAHARILDDFRDGRTRLLVGTQVVAKGHDFPDVHVAAVLGVDHVLGMPDFRAAERTFALVTQLIGRAGRGAAAGRVFLQTRHPEHPVFACVNDMEAFAAHEGHLRRTLGQPPYTRLVLVRLEGVDRAAAHAAAVALAEDARARTVPGVDVLGPSPAPMPRAVGRWRYQVFLRGRNVGVFRTWLRQVVPGWRPVPGVRRIVDVDPRMMM
ncbi:MAG: hypothetical protein RLZZ299_373 [Pseudomonadota bacterium]